MYKVLCVGDPHFKSSNKLDTDALTTEIIRVVNETSPDLVVLLGDILDNGKKIDSPALTRATDLIYSISELVQTYVLIGNHDMINNQQFLTPVNPFTGIRNSDTITIVWKLEKLFIPILESWFLFVPYTPPGRFNEVIEECDMSTVKSIFSHQEYRGASLTSNGSKLSLNGDVWNKNAPFIASGHIHTHAWLQPNILYVGTPMQSDFGDITKKSLSLLTFTNDNALPLEERIELNLRTRRIVHLNVSDAYRWEDIGNNIIWKVYIDGPASEVNMFLRSGKCIWLEQNGVTVVRGTYESSMEINSELNVFKQVTSYKNLLYQALTTSQQELLTNILNG